MKSENITYKQNRKCSGCKQSLQYKSNIVKIGEKTIKQTKLFFKNDEIKINDFICNTCRKKVINYKINDPVANELKIIKPSEIKEPDNDINENKIISNKKILLQQLPTAFSTHKHCLICKKTKGLYVLKKESLMYAYTNHGIIIKKHARSCDDHQQLYT